ncbi:hypothetical protein PENSUB_2656 [Penicillium subrubescens]|uniref:Uncharacterized protein n=1 Tax=Penicillium subrubescens TaxID=1316194 RepID=A0A1Q5UH33_9EURO|nr:hypothetical protein PENSUB_2656 [Penicillium subrubescens]
MAGVSSLHEPCPGLGGYSMHEDSNTYSTTLVYSVCTVYTPHRGHGGIEAMQQSSRKGNIE